MSALLQAFGLGLGALAYLLFALWILRAARNLARGSVALYWRMRSDAENRAQLARVVEMQTRRPESTRRRAA